MKAQKRFNIPRPDLYSSEIVKKNDIPHPEDDEGFRMTPFASEKRSKVSHAAENAKKRQYVQQYPMMQQQQQQQQYAYNNPYASNLLSSGDMYAQQNAGMLQYQQQPQQAVVQQQVASHVQNLDGAIARPIVTGKPIHCFFSQSSIFTIKGWLFVNCSTCYRLQRKHVTINLRCAASTPRIIIALTSRNRWKYNVENLAASVVSVFHYSSLFILNYFVFFSQQTNFYCFSC